MSLNLLAYNPPYGIDSTNSRFVLRGLAVFTATTYAAGGVLPVSYAQIAQQNGEYVQIARLNVNPDTMWIQSIAGSGYGYQYNKSTGKIQIFVNGATAQNPQAELSAGALPTAVINDIIEFEIDWVAQ